MKQLPFIVHSHFETIQLMATWLTKGFLHHPYGWSIRRLGLHSLYFHYPHKFSTIVFNISKAGFEPYTKIFPITSIRPGLRTQSFKDLQVALSIIRLPGSTGSNATFWLSFQNNWTCFVFVTGMLHFSRFFIFNKHAATNAFHLCVEYDETKWLLSNKIWYDTYIRKILCNITCTCVPF